MGSLSKLEESEDEIHNNGITALNHKTKSIVAIAVEYENKPIIIYDKNKLSTQAQRRAVLMHEYCYLKISALYNIKTDNLIKNIIEYKTKKEQNIINNNLNKLTKRKKDYNIYF